MFFSSLFFFPFSGLLHENDEILEINGTDIRGKNVNDVCEFLAEMTGTLTFLIIPASHVSSRRGCDLLIAVKAMTLHELSMRVSLSMSVCAAFARVRVSASVEKLLLIADCQ